MLYSLIDFQPGAELIQSQPGETPGKDWLTLQNLLDLLPHQNRSAAPTGSIR